MSYLDQRLRAHRQSVLQRYQLSPTMDRGQQKFVRSLELRNMWVSLLKLWIVDPGYGSTVKRFYLKYGQELGLTSLPAR